MTTEEEPHEPRSRSRDHSFDELARGLASGTVSRRRALKLVGGALLGGVLASIPGVAAWAQRSPCGPGMHPCPDFGCCPTPVPANPCRQAGEVCGRVGGLCEPACDCECRTPREGGDTFCAAPQAHCASQCSECPTGTICTDVPDPIPGCEVGCSEPCRGGRPDFMPGP